MVLMALSEDEQRKLDEMEIELSRDDPAFAASVSIDRARRRRRIMVTVFRTPDAAARYGIRRSAT